MADVIYRIGSQPTIVAWFVLSAVGFLPDLKGCLLPTNRVVVAVNESDRSLDICRLNTSMRRFC